MLILQPRMYHGRMLASTASSHEQGYVRLGCPDQQARSPRDLRRHFRTTRWRERYRGEYVACRTDGEMNGQTTSGRISALFRSPLLNPQEAQIVQQFPCRSVHARRRSWDERLARTRIRPDSRTTGSLTGTSGCGGTGSHTTDDCPRRTCTSHRTVRREQAKRHQEAWAKHLGVPVEVTNSIGMKLVLIPAGEFMMGMNHGRIGRVLGGRRDRMVERARSTGSGLPSRFTWGSTK